MCTIIIYVIIDCDALWIARLLWSLLLNNRILPLTLKIINSLSWEIILLLLSYITLILIINLVVIIEELILERKHISRHPIFTNNALCCRVVKLKKFTSFFDPYSFHLGHLNELLPLVWWHKPILIEFRTCLALSSSYFIARMIIFFILIWRGMSFTLHFSQF